MTTRARTLPTSLSAIFGAVLLLTACGGHETAPEAISQEAMPVSVTTATTAELPVLIEASGTVEPIRRVRPGTKILGRIDRVPVREGERVAQGRLLARLESGDLEAAVAQAEAAVRRAEADHENAAAQHRRWTDLHGRGSVTDKSLEDAVARYRISAAALEEARAALAAARVTLGYAEVRSPIDGWVTARNVEAGDMAAPGVPFFVLEDLTRIKVVVQVPETEVVGLTAGDEAEVEILGRRIASRIDRVVPSADPGSRTFSVQLVLDNPGDEIKSGTFARARFPRQARPALLVPADSLVTRGQLAGVFVVAADARARLRWVTTGRREGERVEILSGLEPGERFVERPPAGLRDGAAVEAAP